MEKLVLATEDIFLDATDAKRCMDAECLKLVEYLRWRQFETGLVLVDEGSTPDETVQENLSFYLPAEEVFSQKAFDHKTKYFIDNSIERLEKAASKGFTPVLIAEGGTLEDSEFDCAAYSTISDFHLSLIQASFEQHSVN